RQDLWRNTAVVFTSDHGEMNGAHRMTQKGGIHVDEAAVVNMTVCVPGGPQGQTTAAVGSRLCLAPTRVEFAGLRVSGIGERYPHLKGWSLRSAILDPQADGPRGSSRNPGDGALICWDGLHQLDKDWAISGALQEVTEMGVSGPHGQETGR